MYEEEKRKKGLGLGLEDQLSISNLGSNTSVGHSLKD